MLTSKRNGTLADIWRLSGVVNSQILGLVSQNVASLRGTCGARSQLMAVWFQWLHRYVFLLSVLFSAKGISDILRCSINQSLAHSRHVPLLATALMHKLNGFSPTLAPWQLSFHFGLLWYFSFFSCCLRLSFFFLCLSWRTVAGSLVLCRSGVCHCNGSDQPFELVCFACSLCNTLSYL